MIRFIAARSSVLGSALTVGLVAGALSASAFGNQLESVGPGDFGPGDGLDRYVVELADGTTAADVESVPGVSSAQALDGGAVLVAGDLTRHRLREVPGVVEVEESPQGTVLGGAALPGDPYAASYAWNLLNTGSNAHQQPSVAGADSGAPSAWPSGRGEGTVVAVIDTGYDSDHPDLAGALWTNPLQPCVNADTDGNGRAGDCHGWNFVTNSANIDNGAAGTHGTAVAGVVAMRADNGIGGAGVAPEATIMPLVIGSGSTVDLTLGTQAIRYAVDHGADVINASWGGGGTGAGLERLEAAVAYANQRGVLVVAAAGNDSGDRDTSGLLPATLSADNVITVGSSDAADGMSTSSAHGARSVDLFAPGNKVLTAYNDGGYRLVSGTSIASPHVAAAVVLQRALNPGATAAELKDAVLARVDPLPAFAGRSVTGGRLALESMAPAGAGEPTYTFSSMNAVVGTATPRVAVRSEAGPGRYDIALGLAMRLDDGTVWAVADKKVTVEGTTVATDDTGYARFPLGIDVDQAEVSPSVDLAAGRYALVAQVLKEGVPLGRPWAAPLAVGLAAVTAPYLPTTGAPVDLPATVPALPRPGQGDGPAAPPRPGGPGAGTGPEAGTGPGGSIPGGSSPEAAAPPTRGPDAVPTPAPSPTSPGGSQPADPPVVLPGATPEGPGAPGGGPSGPKAPAVVPAPESVSPPAPQPTRQPAPTPAAPPDGGTAPSGPQAPSGSQDYPSVGDFMLTSMTPTRVPTAGGTRVVISGSAIPSDAQVRIGASGHVASTVSDGRISFTTPARPAGAKDVVVYTPGRSSTLKGALTFVAPDGSSTPPGPITPVVTPPASAAPPPDQPGPGAGGGQQGQGPKGQDGSRAGPNGERLVRSQEFSAMTAVWGVTCTGTCRGIRV